MSEINFPEKLAASYHAASLKQEHSVWMAWGDGRVTLTKGGELFGQRKLHEKAGSIPGASCFGWASKFPIKVGEHESYAFVKDEEQAYEIRGMVITRVCEWLEARKILRY